jgi:ABC-2 type transport system ATP-binding protein
MGGVVTAVEGSAREAGAAAAPREASPDRQPLLEASGIAKTYRLGLWPRRRALPVLRGADITLWPGEIVGLVGENGSGKTTLMKILVGSLDRDAGSIRRPKRTGYCPQEPILYARLSCDEHFELFGSGYGMTALATQERSQQIYDALGFQSYAGTRVEALSGGTCAKLNLGLALLPDPDLLLLDEPYAGFDWETYQHFWTIVQERRDLGRSVLIISHFVTDEERFDRIIRLHEGRAVVG